MMYGCVKQNMTLAIEHMILRGDLSDDRIWIFTCGYCIENRDADFGTGISYWKDSVMEKNNRIGGIFCQKKKHTTCIL